MLTRLARWWLARGTRRAPAPAPVAPYVPWGECSAAGCGIEVTGDDIHLIVVMSTDDELLGIDGNTAMCTDYCGEHCPGGCQWGCATITP